MQSKLTKFGHAHRAYWAAVERALVDQYHRDEDVAADWVADEQRKLGIEHGRDIIPDTPPDRMAQEIFMERAQ